MQQPHLRDDHSPGNGQASGGLMRRLDRVAGELNAFLLVLAIGLAVLDLTCFMTLEVSQALQHPFEPQTAQHGSAGGQGYGRL
jgi:hypothetical protein